MNTIEDDSYLILLNQRSTKTAINENQDQNENLGFIPNFKAKVKIVLFLLCIALLFMNMFIQHTKGSSKVTVVVLATNNPEVLQQCINSFYKMNTYPITKIIGILDGVDLQKLKYEKNMLYTFYKFKQIKWKTFAPMIGMISAIDQALKQIETQYTFVIQQNTRFIKKGFIEHTVNLMQKSQNISQVLLNNIGFSQRGKIVTLYDDIRAGFALKSGLFRTKNLLQLQNGLVGFTKNISFGFEAGLCEIVISKHFWEQGYKIVISDIDFIEQIEGKIIQWRKIDDKTHILSKDKRYLTQAELNYCEIAKKVQSFTVLRKGLTRKIIKNLSIQSDKIKLKNQNDTHYEGKTLQINYDLNYNQLNDLKILNEVTYNFMKVFLYQSSSNILKNRRQYSQVTNLIGSSLQQQKIQSILKMNNLTKFQGNDPSKNLIKLLKKQNILVNENNIQLNKIQYQFYDRKYKLRNIKNQLPLCIVVQSKNLQNYLKKSKILTSIEKQNYTNYKVVIIWNLNESAQKSQFYMKKIITAIEYNFNQVLGFKISHIVLNQDQLGPSENIYLRGRQFCKKNDIIVPIYGQNQFYGQQSFNVINAVFQNQQIWFSLFRQTTQEKFVETINLKKGQKIRDIDSKIAFYLKAYRNQLNFKQLIDQLIQFRYNEITRSYLPTFYNTNLDLPLTYPLLQLCGIDRILISEDILSNGLSIDMNGKCINQKQDLVWKKLKLKSTLNQLKSLQSFPILNSQLNIPNIAYEKDVLQSQKLYNTCLIKPDKNNKTIYSQKFNQILAKNILNIKYPNKFQNIKQNYKASQIPFCIILPQTETFSVKKKKILKSLVNQNYTNYKIVQIKLYSQENPQTQQKADQINIKSIKIDEIQIKIATIFSKSYYINVQTYSKVCDKNSLLLFAIYQFQSNSLQKLNQIHQTYNVWAIYSETDDFIQIHTMYMRINFLLQNNDFDGSNKVYLDAGDYQLICLSILQLCRQHIFRVDMASLHPKWKAESQQGGRNPIRAYKQNKKIYTRSPYQTLLNLYQDFDINVQKSYFNLLQHYKGNVRNHIPKNRLNKQNFLRNFEYMQLLYLPNEHSLNQRNFEQAEQQYNISKYMYNQQQQIPLCVVIIGRNNTPNFRYKKNLQSILQQDYFNYHIVFIDDDSDDNTFQAAQNLIKNSQFPRNRITFVENTRRKFATYSIVNAAFNYCERQEIQVLVDGDDELIGKYVFSIVNSIYKKHPQIWTLHTDSLDNLYQYGLSRDPKIQQNLDCSGIPKRRHFFGHLNAPKVKLIRNVPIQFHSNDAGDWLDTLYDDALQTAFTFLAPTQSFKYVPHFSYFRNKQTGSNDDSDSSKVNYRRDQFNHIKMLGKLEKLQSQSQLIDNEFVRQKVTTQQNRDANIIQI